MCLEVPRVVGGGGEGRGKKSYLSPASSRAEPKIKLETSVHSLV